MPARSKAVKPTLVANVVEERATKKLLSTLLLSAMGMSFLLVAITAIAMVRRETIARKDLRKAIEAIKDQGSPYDRLSLTEYLHRLSSPQDSGRWSEQLAILKSTKYTNSLVQIPIEDHSFKTKMPSDKTLAFLQEWNPLIGSIRELAKLQLLPDAQPSRFSLPSQVSGDPEFDLPVSLKMGKLLRLDGKVAVWDRDSARILIDIETLLGCSCLPKGQPTNLSTRVAMAVERMAIELLKIAVEKDAINETDLALLLPQLMAKTKIGPEWERTIFCERSNLLSYYKEPNAEFRVPILARDLMNVLAQKERILSIPVDDFGLFLSQLKNTEDEFDERVNRGWMQHLDTLHSYHHKSAYTQLGTALVANASLHRLAVLAVGIRLFEKRVGRFPKELRELSTLGLDCSQLMPLGEKPFGYYAGPKRIQLWGFNPERHQETPSKPPTVHNDEFEMEYDIWDWQLQIVAPEQGADREN